MKEFDIEFVVPFTRIEPKYAQRVEDFKKHGLLNIEGKKVLVTALVGTEYFDNIEKGWAKNITVKSVPGTFNQESAKIYEYFATSDKIAARWTAKIDDDSCNDVSSLVDKLDLEFDCEREYYVVTELRHERWRHEDDILLQLGFHRWFENPKTIMWHELEGSVVSQAALERILNDRTAKKFLTARAKIPQGYCDYALACAARICKIYPTDAYFMSKDPFVGEFSLFGGHLAHIHNLSNDKNPHAFDLFKRILNKDIGSDTEIYKNLVDREFAYKKIERDPFRIIRLKDNGMIDNGAEEKIWHVKPNSTIEFLRRDGSLIVVFDNYDNPNLLEGYAIQPKGHKSLLRRLAV
jgi:hypothetical protein